MKVRSILQAAHRLRASRLFAILAALLCAAASACAQISPTTGCEVPPGRFLPVLVSVGYGYGTARINGKNVQAAGAGKVALWGMQQADIVYESLLYREEKKDAASTRLTLLFSDALIRGEAVNCGPVRSLREVSVSLREEWQGALVFGSPMGSGRLGEAAERLKLDSSTAFDIVDIRRDGMGGRLQGVKAPSNLNVDVNAVQARVAADSVARPFAFSQDEARTNVHDTDDAASVPAFTLDWGDARYLACFIWDEAAGGYLREVAGWPFACYPTADARMAGEEDAMVRPVFANVIVQWVTYDALSPTLQNPSLVGEGKADLFMGGRHVSGTWAREGQQMRTVYRDTSGQEILLCPGKTWIALFPVNAALIF
ncbi:MAG: DUF3048 domain-containing protein [Clostridiales bacterium]|nr:DUF3048 domain-containing protein [Clostridiales bacterium]